MSTRDEAITAYKWRRWARLIQAGCSLVTAVDIMHSIDMMSKADSWYPVAGSKNNPQNTLQTTDQYAIIRIEETRHDEQNEYSFVDGIEGEWTTFNGKSKVFIAASNGRIVCGCDGKYNGLTIEEAINADSRGIIEIRDRTDYDAIDQFAKSLMNKGLLQPSFGTARRPEPVEVLSANYHSSIHGVTLQEAQEYVSYSVVMFDQGDRMLYMSAEGNAILLDANQRLVSAYPRSKFHPGVTEILEAILSE